MGHSFNECNVCGSEEGKKHLGWCDEHYECQTCGGRKNLFHTESTLFCDSCYEAYGKKLVKEFEGDTHLASEITCPWCGYIPGDSWEREGDYEEDEECSRCGNIYYYTRHVSVDYSTNKQEEKTKC